MDLVPHPVVVEDPERSVDPRRTPPLPAEAPTTPRSHQMAPHLLLDPLLHEPKAPCRVPDSEVVHPSPQDWIDHRDHLPHRLRVPAPEHFPEPPQQRRPLLDGRRLLHPPPARGERSRRKVKPRNPNASPCVKSTIRLFVSFTRRSSFASSSRSRRSTALSSHRFRHWPF